MNISASSATKALAALPFGYFALTRLKTTRDYAYLIASSWLPAIWLVIRLAGREPMDAVSTFLAGYVAFISAYEIGYLANDAWDAQRSDDGRERISFGLSWPFIVIFLAVRFGVWTAIGVHMDWIGNGIWLLGYVALAAAFVQHNLVKSKGLRLASFYELATLRFLLPIVAVMSGPSLPAPIMVALFLYAYPRLLSYMDSKGVLLLSERRGPSFAFLQLASLAPIFLYLAYIVESAVMRELFAYFALLYAVWWAIPYNRWLEGPQA